MSYNNDMSGTLSKNERKSNDRQPDFRGQITIEGKKYWLSGWNRRGNRGDFISLAAQPTDDNRGSSGGPGSGYGNPDEDDNRPF